jgi:hypothetical protein
MKRTRLHLFSMFVVGWTLLTIMSGAAVTSSRGLFQNAHMMAGLIDAVLIAGLVIWRRRGWSILALVAAEAGSGKLGFVHACLAALLFASVAAINLFTSPSWQEDPELVQDYGRPSLRFLSSAAAVFVALQIGFGAGFRHGAVSVLPHLLGAMAVALFIMIVGAFVTHQFPKHRSLRPLATAFMTITGIQVFLGMATFLMRLMNMAEMPVFLATSASHVATGNLTFAVSVLLALEIRRSVLARAA